MIRTQSSGVFATMAALLTGVGILGSFISPAPASAGILDAIFQPNYGVPYYGQQYRAPYVAYGGHYVNGPRTMFVPVVSSRYSRPCRVSYYDRAPRGRAIGYYNNQWGRGRSNRSHHHHDD